MWAVLKDAWSLFGRLFPFPTKPGLRRIGSPDRAAPVLVTCNYELTVRRLVRTLQRAGIDAWLLVAPTKGINVWCAAGGGHFTADTVVSAVKTSGIEDLVDHRRVILPQLSASGVNSWSLRKRTGWKPRFGPAHVRDLPAYLRSGKATSARAQRRVRFELKDRFAMGTNLGLYATVLLALPLLIASIWIGGLWWQTLPLLLPLCVLGSVLTFWLPGRPGVQKGLALGVMAAAVFVVLSQAAWDWSPWSVLGGTVWILLVSAYVGYELPGWSPLWRQDLKEIVLGVKNTRVEINPERCVGCHLCDIVCPANVFGYDGNSRKCEVVNLDACQACGACLENCPSAAITSNFRAGQCACPTCALINGAAKISGRKGKDEPAVGAAPLGAPAPEPSRRRTSQQECQTNPR